MADAPAAHIRAMPARLAGIATALLASLPAIPVDARADWLPWRDANPFVAASGLPFAPPAAADARWQVEAIVSASNTELAFDRGSEHLVYDAETHEARIAVTRAFGEHWLARATIGSVSFGDGFLDGFLVDWHRAFGLDNGDRGHLGTDGHVIDYHDGTTTLAFDRTLHATTPLLVDVAWRAPIAAGEWMLGGTLKLPTTHASVLVDDRAVDASLWLAAQSTDASAALPWGVRVGAMRRGDTRLLPDRANELVPFVDATLGWRFAPQWDVAAQLQWHGALYDSAIPYLDDAATLALSSAWHSKHGWSLRAGLVEDAIPRHAQDVTFFVSLGR
jgi:hypothetical protein